MSHFQRIFLILCLLLTPYTLHSREVSQNEAEDLYRLLAQSKMDSSRVKLYLQLGNYYIERPGSFQSDMDSAFAYANQAKELSRTLGFTKGIAGSQKVFAHVFLGSKRIGDLRALLEKMKPDKNKADVLQWTGRYYLQKPYELDVDLDSADYYAQSALNLQVQLNDSLGYTRSLIMLAHINNERGDFLKKKQYQKEATLAIEKVKDLSTQAGLWFVLGSSYTRSEEPVTDRIIHYRKALALYRQLGNREREAFILRWIADMHQYQGDYAQSLRELLEVLRIQKSIGLKNLHYTYELLGQVYSRMGNYELALPYGLDAIRSARTSGDTLNLDKFYSLMGQIYMDLNQHEKALEMHRTVLTKLSREPDNVRSQFRFINIRKMSQSLIALKRPQEALTLIENFLETNPPNMLLEEIVAALSLGKAFMGLQDYTEAEKHLKGGLAKASGAKGNAGWTNFYDINDEIMLFHANLTALYLATGQLQKAAFHLNQHFQMLNKQPDLIKLSNLHLQAFKLDSMQDNLSSAIAHYQQYKALQDSVFNERKSNQIIAYQVQYETEKKEQDLQLKEQSIKTLIQEKQLQQEKINKALLLRNGIIGGAILLLLFLAVIYNRYRLKQQSNRLLKDQQNKLQEQHEELQSQQVSLKKQQQQIQEKNQELELHLDEKDRLLKEIHHRVKNNLQIVMSLLNSQVASLQDKAALTAIQDSLNRVQAMALIHQKLYQADGVARILMKAYVKELVAYLQDSYDLSFKDNFKLLIGQIELDVNIAIPLGLIINEAITNAFKYAFPGKNSGTILISLLQKSDKIYELTIEDDGVGYPKSFNPSQSRSLGMTLIHGFSAQLGGELSIQGSDGVKISLVFSDEKLSSIHNKAEYVF
ncbi:histidine kinase dimerization/phosphoacceptor domain -containing protein [Algoriphagus sp. NG3]|uniref:tetratricopeptide repeat-containing sensor histidine kinase n=1 Tax=Algoriphagus sp. NG3 TaxID=3097546 RepID=UPI002A829F6A|nr:histidine kinase dimerization/phosphoacceptor domain -containing protein [Algoriphagus sp. NG3]WPR77319.1 histidine kinase dimerization/phosphoacceptor domain -containing protein [Algoriphagus sp. NG3]